MINNNKKYNNLWSKIWKHKRKTVIINRIVRDVLWIYYQRKQRLKKIKVNVKISKKIKLKRINTNKQKINLVYKRQKNKRKRRD